MALSFRKRIRIIPGLAINLSTSGIGASVGAGGVYYREPLLRWGSLGSLIRRRPAVPVAAKLAPVVSSNVIPGRIISGLVVGGVVALITIVHFIHLVGAA